MLRSAASPIMCLLVATTNPGKAREFRHLLHPVTPNAIFPDDLGIQINVIEDGATYEDNAIKKATAYCMASGLVTVADDSGLEVDALGGAPGIRSARYAVGRDADRVEHLLAQMSHVSPRQRTARFRCALAIVTPCGATHVAEGACEGIIAQAPSGTGGFGYDPVFWLPEHGCTMADLGPDVKNRISHRARAVAAALPVLNHLLR